MTSKTASRHPGAQRSKTPRPKDIPYTAAALAYAEAVVAGEILACKWTRLACQRQLDDLERAAAGDPNFPYRFDTERAERVCGFVEKMRHVKGDWAKRGESIRLEGWQTFVLTTVFGWIRLGDGLRRFRKVYLEVGRKNAKSTLMAAVALYMLACDGEAGAEIYTTATKKDQAKIVFGDAKKMAEKAVGYRKRFDVEALTNSITCRRSGGIFKPLDAEGKTQDGLNPHFSINDELHAQRKRTLYDVIETGMGARSQPIMWDITTAGVDLKGVCYEQRSLTTKILDRTIADETIFGVIYTLDEGDRWDDEAVWIKANPNLGVSVHLDYLRRMASKASNSTASRAAFQIKNMNMWLRGAGRWIDMQKFDACADPTLTLEDLAGWDVQLGLDLASKLDLTARIAIADLGEKIAVVGKFYLPEARAEIEGNEHYKAWSEDGFLELTPGNATDLDKVEADIIEDSERLRIVDIGHDPWQAAQMITHLMEAGLSCTEVRPTVANFSEPMKELEAMIEGKTIVHDGNPVLRWTIGNVVCWLDAKDNIYPRKNDPEEKIDGAIALITAIARHLVRQAEGVPTDVYATRAQSRHDVLTVFG